MYAALLLAVYVNTAAAQHKPADTSSINGSWVLVPVLASDTATGKMPTIQFDVARQTLTGFNGCNRMSGHVNIHGGQLLFDEHIILTKMLCEGYNEKPFMDNLLRVKGYKIEDGVLLLLDGQAPLSKWKRVAVANEL
jgi:heat shock protein HslJ